MYTVRHHLSVMVSVVWWIDWYWYWLQIVKYI